MANEFIIQRHQKIWEEQNLFIKRLVVGILVIGFLILLKVLIPFVHNAGETVSLREEVAKISQDMAPLEQSKAELHELDNTLQSVKTTISRAPWMKERDDLIRKLARINQEQPEGGTEEEYQNAADSAIKQIAEQVGRMVISPLEKALPADQESSGLAVGIATLRTDIEQWKHDQMGKVWYRTIHEKDAKLHELDTSLHVKLAKISPLLQKAQDRIKTARDGLSKKMVEIKEDINQRAKELKGLEKDMKQIVPEWLSWLVEVKQMIQLFPLLFPLVAIYVLVIAVRLSVHYQFVVHGLSLSPNDLQDFSVSSIWTFIYRGLFGVVLTTGLYLIIIGVCWILFEQGAGLLIAWLDTEPDEAWFNGGSDITTLLWAGRSIFIGLIGFIFIQFYRHRNSLGH